MLKTTTTLVILVLLAAAAPTARAACLTGLKWPTPPDASFYYNAANKVPTGQCISSSQMDSAVTGQLGTWKALTYAGTTTKKANKPDNTNVVGWANLGGQTLGITNYIKYGNPILTCGANSFYTAMEIDVRLSTAYRWTSTQGSCPCAAGSAIYLNGVAQHEFGHAIGLCHTNVPSSLMYPSFGVCENKSKGADEVAGENALCY
jgi:hypothetical protein